MRSIHDLEMIQTYLYALELNGCCDLNVEGYHYKSHTSRLKLRFVNAAPTQCKTIYPSTSLSTTPLLSTSTSAHPPNLQIMHTRQPTTLTLAQRTLPPPQIHIPTHHNPRNLLHLPRQHLPRPPMPPLAYTSRPHGTTPTRIRFQKRVNHFMQKRT